MDPICRQIQEKKMIVRHPYYSPSPEASQDKDGFFNLPIIADNIPESIKNNVPQLPHFAQTKENNDEPQEYRKNSQIEALKLWLTDHGTSHLLNRSDDLPYIEVPAKCGITYKRTMPVIIQKDHARN